MSNLEHGAFLDKVNRLRRQETECHVRIDWFEIAKQLAVAADDTLNLLAEFQVKGIPPIQIVVDEKQFQKIEKKCDPS